MASRGDVIQMNKLWQQLAIATNWPVLAAVAVLTSLGCLSIWADSRADGQKQLAFIFVGVLAMTAFQAVDYRLIGRFSWPFYFASAALIFYTVLGTKMSLPFAKPIKGQCNWINFGAMSLQPAELMKVAFVMVMARYLRFRSNYRTITGLLPPFGLALFPLALILKQPDLGTALVFIPALFTMLFVAGAKLWHLAAIVGAGVLVAGLLWMCGPAPGPSTPADVATGPGLPVLRHFPAFVKKYQRDRVYAMFSRDEGDDQNINYQSDRALTAIGSGGVAGKGFGRIPVGRGVPEGHNDMVFSLIGEQFGFVGSAIVLAAYIVLFTAGVEIASATREPFGRIVALGIVATMAGQTFINLMVVLRLMPVTGITLPFVSYGGSSLLASFMSAGLLLNIGQNRPIVMARESFEFDA
jgi:cell division protein FtsW (lipid II flippase)